MPLAHFTTGTHDPRCTGCPACDEGMVRLLAMTDAELAAYNRGRQCEQPSMAAHCTTKGPTAMLNSDDRPPAVPSLCSAIRRLREHGAADRVARLRVYFMPPAPPDEETDRRRAAERARPSEPAPAPPDLAKAIRQSRGATDGT